MSVSVRGRWTWYRSIQSVCSRRSELSTSRMIQRRDEPCWLGSGPIDMWNFVGRVPASRRPLDALPEVLPGPPAELDVGVFEKFEPGSHPPWDVANEPSWAGLPHEPNIIAPRHILLTETP